MMNSRGVRDIIKGQNEQLIFACIGSLYAVTRRAGNLELGCSFAVEEHSQARSTR